ncbi:uncharacterized protein LOC114515675 [Dendronephthya gigantea]|uniref:uncharacterized protein LOC114515675 n=1 Tax=Dendronephthya gigantea TaxID=151771 RepID=UPI00106BDC3E|nr:uncharacterized protein LOC114515675 [Dendronephthya gigantea]
MVLQECGLGRRKICFNSKGNYSNLEEKLFKEFPKLADGGGFQIMRTGLGGNSSSLAVTPPPPSGYSVSFLRDASGLGQALAYVRPLQQDLDTKVNPVSDADLNTTNVQKVECINCGEKVVMLMWEQHTTSCQGGPSSRMNESVQVTTNASCTEKCDLPKDIIVVKCDDVQDEDNIKVLIYRVQTLTLCTAVFSL